MADVYKAMDFNAWAQRGDQGLKGRIFQDLNFVDKVPHRGAVGGRSGKHRNIVNIYDVGSERGMHYIVMEYVEGITLKKTYIEKKGQLSCQRGDQALRYRWAEGN